jgi:hypothetical protein
MATIPVEAGQLRLHPSGHALRVGKIYHPGYKCSNADCKPEPPVKGRRATNIAIKTLETYPLITPSETTL